MSLPNWLASIMEWSLCISNGCSNWSNSDPANLFNNPWLRILILFWLQLSNKRDESGVVATRIEPNYCCSYITHTSRINCMPIGLITFVQECHSYLHAIYEHYTTHTYHLAPPSSSATVFNGISDIYLPVTLNISIKLWWLIPSTFSASDIFWSLIEFLKVSDKWWGES